MRDSPHGPQSSLITVWLLRISSWAPCGPQTDAGSCSGGSTAKLCYKCEHTHYRAKRLGREEHILFKVFLRCSLQRVHICGLKRWNTDAPMGRGDLETINWRADETGGCVSLALAAAGFMFR